jgi:hypothetical protein
LDGFFIVLTLCFVAALVALVGYQVRDFRRQILSRDLERFKVELEARHEAEVDRLRADLKGTVTTYERELERARDDLRAAAREQEAELARLQERRGEVVELVSRGLEQLKLDVQARQDAAVERLRSDLRQVPTTSGDAGEWRERRAEVIAELYRRLAKVESTIAALTNPFLLPGEPYAVPTEFVAEALKWEHWKDVGDAAFAFADYFNQHRLQFDEAGCGEITRFIITLRETLTRSIYPNLQPTPSPEQLQTLRGALDRISGELPAIRRLVERQFRELFGVAGGEATAS